MFDFPNTDHVGGVAVDRTTGDVYFVSNNHQLAHTDANGKPISHIDADGDKISWLTLGVRVGPGGKLYNCGDNNRNIQCLSPSGARLWSADVGDGSLFAVGNSGTVYVPEGEEESTCVKTISPDGKKVVVWVDHGNDWRLGEVRNAKYATIFDGRIYVLEGQLGDLRSRIDVFDPQGRLERVFGRGSKSQRDDPAPGYIQNAEGIEFGPDGNLYVLSRRQDDVWMFVFKRF